MPITAEQWNKSKETEDSLKPLYDAIVSISKHMVTNEGFPDTPVRIKYCWATHAASHESKRTHVQYGTKAIKGTWFDDDILYGTPHDYLWYQEGRLWRVKGASAARIGLTKEERMASVIVEEVAHAMCSRWSKHGSEWKRKFKELSIKYNDYIINVLGGIEVEMS